MKKICIIIFFLVGSYAADAQMDQILKTMLEQIAQLKLYLSLVEKGYSIAENGLHTIRDIKNGEFNLHSNYFGSLKQVKPSVADMDALNGIRSLQARIMSQGQALLKTVRSSSWLLPSEAQYITSFVNVSIQECNKDVAALNALTTNGSLSLSDGDRVMLIQALYEDMQKQDAVMSGYGVQVNELAISRAHDAGMLNDLKKLYGL